MLPKLIGIFHFLRVLVALTLLCLRNAIRSLFCGLTSICSCSCKTSNTKKNDDATSKNVTDDDGASSPYRVCVVGGGIAGMSAAYGLARIHNDQSKSNSNSNNRKIEITVLEPRQCLGGNAKTHDWTPSGYAGLRTGLSVLAWPASLFHNYELMLRELRQEIDVVTPTFMVSRDGKEMHWVHTDSGSDLAASVNGWAHADMNKWDRAVGVARRINHAAALLGLSLYALCVTVPATGFLYVASALIGLFQKFSGKSPQQRTAGNWASKCLAASASKKNVFDRLRDTKKSLYTFSVLNPLNIISLEFWMCTCFGVSRRFWDTVAIPVYSSSFLTTAFHELPATIVVPLDDIISVGAADPCKPLHTWRQSSKDVFDALQREILAANPGKNRVQTGAVVEHVIPHQFEKENGGNAKEANTNIVKWTRYTTTPSDSQQSQQQQTVEKYEERFDAVVFACPGPDVRKLVHCSNSTTHSAHRPGLLGVLLDEIVGGVTYEDTRDDNYVTGYIHDDASVIPHSPADSALQPDIYTTFFSRNFSNYVRIFDETTTQMCNVFSLGTWVPAALRHEAAAARAKSQQPKGHLPLFVSYDGPRNSLNRKRPGAVPLPATCAMPVDDARLSHPGPAPAKICGEVDNSNAHPRLNLVNLARMWSLRFLQGESGLYYAGNYTTPGNGHDLSLLSGMSVASKIGRDVYQNNANSGSASAKEATLVNHPMLKFLGTRLPAFETEMVRQGESNGNAYAAAVSAQSDFELLRGMMGLN